MSEPKMSDRAIPYSDARDLIYKGVREAAARYGITYSELIQILAQELLGWVKVAVTRHGITYSELIQILAQELLGWANED
jgi:ribosomal protein L20